MINLAGRIINFFLKGINSYQLKKINLILETLTGV